MPSPLDVFKGFLAENEIEFVLSDEGDGVRVLLRQGENHQVDFLWMAEEEVLHLTYALPFEIDTKLLFSLRELIARINEHLWVGHLEYWLTEGGHILFRYGFPLTGGVIPARSQIASIYRNACTICESYIPAFVLLRSGSSSEEALRICLLEVQGPTH